MAVKYRDPLHEKLQNKLRCENTVTFKNSFFLMAQLDLCSWNMSLYAGCTD